MPDAVCENETSPRAHPTRARTTRDLILVVDDDPPIRELWKSILGPKLDVDLVEAKDGADAVRVAQNLRPTVIIMDLAMPNVDGFEAIRRLKADTATARIPVIAITGAVFDSQGALDAGFNDYLLKPVAPAALLERVSRALRRAGAH